MTKCLPLLQGGFQPGALGERETDEAVGLHDDAFFERAENGGGEFQIGGIALGFHFV